MEKLELEARLNIPLSTQDLMSVEYLARYWQSNKQDKTSNRITKASVIRAMISLFREHIEELKQLQVKNEKDLIKQIKTFF